MRYLIDTHIFLWMTSDRERVSPAVLAQLNDAENEIYFSAVVSWEIATKRNRGKLHFSVAPLAIARRIGLFELAITAEHCELASDLAAHHRDPFDRLLVAQAQVENLILVTGDPMLARFGVPILRN